ncbi:hypothetical protein CYMTET_32296 [Cymbomonas tetramitiformis]|uniref:Uncharacterized protein n=1 Tax=Cymbomonas tetramitiformis TaxID=36881 RepID=A0AAE0FG13_9CHLO|nr:hypothetical protein CYMTET_32296 [Cymbomonas tetramitiformis]
MADIDASTAAARVQVLGRSIHHDAWTNKTSEFWRQSVEREMGAKNGRFGRKSVIPVEPQLNYIDQDGPPQFDSHAKLNEWKNRQMIGLDMHKQRKRDDRVQSAHAHGHSKRSSSRSKVPAKGRMCEPKGAWAEHSSLRKSFEMPYKDLNAAFQPSFRPGPAVPGRPETPSRPLSAGLRPQIQPRYYDETSHKEGHQRTYNSDGVGGLLNPPPETMSNYRYDPFCTEYRKIYGLYLGQPLATTPDFSHLYKTRQRQRTYRSKSACRR